MLGAWLLFAMSQTPNVTVKGVVIVIYDVTNTGCHIISLAIVYRILIIVFYYDVTNTVFIMLRIDCD